MAHPILMPRPGQMTEECTLLAWHKDEGDPIKRGDVLFEIETDKATMEVEAFEEGVLLRRVVRAGETVPVNAVCAYVGQPGEEVPDTPDLVAAEGPTVVDRERQAVAEGTSDLQPGAAEAAGARRTRPGRASPRARRLAATSGIDLSEVTGTGPDGRIVERDIQEAIARGPAAPRMPAAEAAPAPLEAPAGGAWNAEEEPPQPLSRMRRVIAERMAASTSTAPQFSVTVAVDVTRLVALRERLKASGRSLTVTDFVALAAAQSLVEMPLVNSRTDGVQLWLRRRVHIGIAVAVPDGLVVVVLRDTDHLTLDEIREQSAALASDARAGRLSPDAMSGSTLTISNLGMYGVEQFSAIVNPGESAILAVGSATATPVVVGEGIGIRSLMRLTLSADHRLVDGEMAARFLDNLRRRLERPEPLAARRLEL